ncbi:hypothetical protein [Neptuniibacter sp. QD37_11]|uniref:hypothetical protein n=1 Tax=Neptuniibacter sp. QD37_11 TaxID=3398209 RepID=UPI0039F5684A
MKIKIMRLDNYLQNASEIPSSAFILFLTEPHFCEPALKHSAHRFLLSDMNELQVEPWARPLLPLATHSILHDAFNKLHNSFRGNWDCYPLTPYLTSMLSSSASHAANTDSIEELIVMTPDNLRLANSVAAGLDVRLKEARYIPPFDHGPLEHEELINWFVFKKVKGGSV